MKRKGFTLVELLVVIAILAILATVSILGYTSFTRKAKLSNDETLVKQWNTLLEGQEVVDGTKLTTPSEVRALFIENGSSVDDFIPTTEGYHFYYNKEDNRIYLVDNKTNKSTYPNESVSNAIGSLHTDYVSTINMIPEDIRSDGEPTVVVRDNVLYVVGSGDMTDYTYSKLPAYLNNDIKKIVVQDGITSIGDFAFFQMSGVEDVIMSSTVEKIGRYAFYEATGLLNINTNFSKDWKLRFLWESGINIYY